MSNIINLSDYATPYAEGTPYSSMADSASAIRGAAEAALDAGARLVGHGIYRVDSNITLKCDADLGQATFVTNSTSLVPVRIGTALSGQLVIGQTVVAPRVINEHQVTGAGWSGSGVGVEICNVYSATITVPYVHGFTTGLLVTAYDAGCGYNRINLGYLDNNKVNLRLYPWDTEAWVNENTFEGGRLAHKSAEGDSVGGTRQIFIGVIANGKRPNNNRFMNVSLEGDVPFYHLECYGKNNLFFWCRWESSHPRVKWNSRSSSVAAKQNLIFGGASSEDIVVTSAAYCANNTITNGWL